MEGRDLRFKILVLGIEDWIIRVSDLAMLSSARPRFDIRNSDYLPWRSGV